MNDTTQPTTIGDRIAAARKTLALTQQDLADAVGVTFQAVSKWEIGGSLPDVSLLAPIAETLRLTLDTLLTGAPAPASDGDASATAADAEPRAKWGKIMGEVTKDIHADTGTILGTVAADIYGNIEGDIVGTVQNVYGNVEGNITGEVHGDVAGYVGGRLAGLVTGRVKGGVRGRVLGTIIGDGINVDASTLDQASRARKGRGRR